MKLLFAIVQDDDVRALTRALVEHELSVTRIASTGGFLRGGNSTLMIGVEANRLDTALDIIHKKSRRRNAVAAPPPALQGMPEGAPLPMQVSVGGATVFVVDVESFHKY